VGLADVESYLGNFQNARELLQPAIEEGLADGDTVGAAGKLVIVAETYLAEGNFSEAAEIARKVVETSDQLSHRVAAALVAIGAGDPDTAQTIGDSLSESLQTQSRAYGEMIQANLLREQGDFVAAIDKLRSAIEMADLWLIRYQLGRAYLDAGYFAEATDEFHICSVTRIGEATAAFLDDTPTYRYLAELPYWKGRADEGFGMQEAAIKDYQAFLELRPNGGPLADDARQRLSR
jgi:tetratricopeptide (TPR) repeat protein